MVAARSNYLYPKKNSPLLAFVGISRIYRNIVKNGEMKHEMTLFHTMGPNKNVLFQILPSFCDHIYGLA